MTAVSLPLSFWFGIDSRLALDFVCLPSKYHMYGFPRVAIFENRIYYLAEDLYDEIEDPVDICVDNSDYLYHVIVRVVETEKLQYLFTYKGAKTFVDQNIAAGKVIQEELIERFRENEETLQISDVHPYIVILD